MHDLAEFLGASLFVLRTRSLLPALGEHGVVAALEQLTAGTFGHNLVTRADGDDFGDIEDDANYADLKGEFWHAGRDSRAAEGCDGFATEGRSQPPTLRFEVSPEDEEEQ
jgi:hypothetical protein